MNIKGVTEHLTPKKRVDTPTKQRDVGRPFNGVPGDLGTIPGVDKTWPRPWPTLWPTLWPTGGRFFRTSLSIALNLCKQRASSICHTYDSLLSSLLSVSHSNFLSRLVVLCNQEKATFCPHPHIMKTTQTMGGHICLFN